MISVKNVSKKFDDLEVFNNVSFEIKKGDSVVIIGGSGCGKSTLLRCINRLTEPETGEIYINGENILAKDADVDSIRKGMGMVYQQFNLFSHLNVLENVMLAPMKINGLSTEEAMAEAKKQLSTVGMLNHMNHMPDQLSGGQKQRVAIARTLAMHPDVILFDEPTSALDPTMVDEVENVIRKLVDEGMTCVIVTHEMRFAKNIASKVIFLAEKGIYETGTAEEVFDNPKRKLTRQFLYRSRMYETFFTKYTFDPYRIREELSKMIQRYEYDPSQIKFFAVLMDEVIYPLINLPGCSDMNCELRLICSETSKNHMLMVSMKGMDEDPLTKLDELNLKIAESMCNGLFSSKNAEGKWELCIQL